MRRTTQSQKLRRNERLLTELDVNWDLRKETSEMPDISVEVVVKVQGISEHNLGRAIEVMEEGLAIAQAKLEVVEIPRGADDDPFETFPEN